MAGFSNPCVTQVLNDNFKTKNENEKQIDITILKKKILINKTKMK